MSTLGYVFNGLATLCVVQQMLFYHSMLDDNDRRADGSIDCLDLIFNLLIPFWISFLAIRGLWHV